MKNFWHNQRLDGERGNECVSRRRRSVSRATLLPALQEETFTESVCTSAQESGREREKVITRCPVASDPSSSFSTFSSSSSVMCSIRFVSSATSLAESVPALSVCTGFARACHGDRKRTQGKPHSSQWDSSNERVAAPDTCVPGKSITSPYHLTHDRRREEKDALSPMFWCRVLVHLQHFIWTAPLALSLSLGE